MKSRANGSLGWLIAVGLVSACGTDHQQHAIDACADVVVRDQVELEIVHAVEPSLLAENGVVVADDQALQLSGVGHAELACSTLSKLQALGDARVAIEQSADLTSVRGYGASEVAILELGTSQLELRFSGKAKLAIARLDVDEVEIQAGGQSEVALNGMAGSANVSSVGSAALDLSALKAQSVSIAGSGSGPLAVWATAHLTIGSDVVREPAVTGSPEVIDERAESP